MVKKQDRLLELLQETPNELVEYETIFDEVWGVKDDYFMRRTLQVHVSKLRQRGHNIQTMHKKGLRLNV